jgi:hypothetical protein
VGGSPGRVPPPAPPPRPRRRAPPPAAAAAPPAAPAGRRALLSVDVGWWTVAGVLPSDPRTCWMVGGGGGGGGPGGGCGGGRGVAIACRSRLRQSSISDVTDHHGVQSLKVSAATDLRQSSASLSSAAVSRSCSPPPADSRTCRERWVGRCKLEAFWSVGSLHPVGRHALESARTDARTGRSVRIRKWIGK